MSDLLALITSIDEYTREEIAENGNGMYGGKRHDEICNYFALQGYGESEINDFSVGIWKGIDAEKKVWVGKIQSLEAENAKLKAELVKERECVDFYAEFSNWSVESHPADESSIFFDNEVADEPQGDSQKGTWVGGKRARQRQKERDNTNDDN